MNKNKKAVYPVEPWDITETGFLVDVNYRNETTFSLSNGYIGTRGTFEEAYDFDIETGLEGNFINGFYEQEAISYGEWNFGFPTESQTLLNLPNAKVIRLFLDDEELDLRWGTVADYKRVLHMKEGVLERNFVWTSKEGKSVKAHVERLVSLTHKNRMAIRYQVTPLNFTGSIKLVSGIRADVENHTRKTNPLVDYGPFGRRLFPDAIESGGKNDTLYYEGTAKHSRLAMACGCMHAVAASSYQRSFQTGDFDVFVTYEIQAKEGKPVCLEKYIVYTAMPDKKKEELREFAFQELDASVKMGWERMKQEQKDYVHAFWENADIRITGETALLQGLRFNLFHIMQNAGRDGKTGMGAKGLSGEGYEGHYFWDTEMYVLPVFIYEAPELAKSLLHFRYGTLPQARDRAKVLGHPRGALYPWRTINGTEASTYYPLGAAQYHINADIAYAFWLYWQVTGDWEFLKEEAAEVLCETARVWADAGSFADCRNQQYCICCVTGPDEYNALVDNNFYTNLMARENIRYALKALEMLREKEEAAYWKLWNRIGLKEEELVLWKRIVDNMYLPYDEGLGIFPQDDGFLMRKPWDDSRIPPEKRRLLYENYHPLFVFRQRMSKQADAILGLYLQSHLFTKEEIRRNYDFYQTVTLHHSSLSTCIFGIVACRIGYEQEAYQYFMESARMDLDDYHDNFYAGIHAANMAGTWQAMVNGFAGVRVNAGYLEFHPILPKNWEGYEFSLLYQNSRLKISVTRGNISVVLRNPVPAVFRIGDKEIQLKKEGECVNEKI